MCPVRSCIGLGAVTFPGAYQTLCLAAPQLRVMSPAQLCSLSGLAVVSLLSISPPHSLQCYNRPPPEPEGVTQNRRGTSPTTTPNMHRESATAFFRKWQLDYISRCASE